MPIGSFFAQPAVIGGSVLFLFVLISVLSFLLLNASDKAKQLAQSLKNVRISFNELDEQARLIVRTDLELNKAQEELDKRLSGLDALQKTSRLISTTLDESEIYECLDLPRLTELGFEKYLICTPHEEEVFSIRICFGYSSDEKKAIHAEISHSPLFTDLLSSKKFISSISSSEEEFKTIAEIMNVKHFVLTPFFAQNDTFGIIFAGNESRSISINEGDEELISILADQIGQAIKNARLFEEVYRSSQNLESTVQERTKQLSSVLEEVKRISNTKTEFISAVSHELRTPLTSIKGYASILISGKLGDIPEKVKERLEKINKHSDNLVKLINDLLDISRIESGKVELNFVDHNLRSTLESVEDLLSPQLKDRNIHFVKEVQEGLPNIPVDVTQIDRVFINLIGNAIKFTPSEGTIKVRIEFDNETITASVSDTGVGISDSDATKLFNEFYRVDNEINQTVKGSGLGLALAKKIIDAHKGQMWLKSELNKGTTFYFTLPMNDSTIKKKS